MVITEDDVKFNFWDDDDFDKELGFDMEDFMEKCEQKEKPQCIVHCYMEDWEAAAIKDQKNIVGQTKLLKKYGGLQFFDPDTEKMVTVDDKKLHWSSTKGSRGWCLISYSSDYIEG